MRRSPSSGPALSEQYPRVLRFYKRITHGNKISQRYLDDLWSFFQQCWHLKDWIKQDPAIPLPIRMTVEKEVRKRRYLKICGDLANRSKHLRLTRGKGPKAPTRKGAKLVRKILVNIAEDIYTGNSEGSIAYYDSVIRVGGSEMGAIQLATKALKQWDTILTNWKLK